MAKYRGIIIYYLLLLSPCLSPLDELSVLYLLHLFRFLYVYYIALP